MTMPNAGAIRGALFFVVLLAWPAVAADWELLGTTPQGDKVSVDRESIAKTTWQEGLFLNLMKAWTKTVYATPQPVGEKRMKEELLYIGVSCRNRTYRIFEGTQFYTDGTSGPAAGAPTTSETDQTRMIVPDSGPEMVHKKVCADTGSKKKKRIGIGREKHQVDFGMLKQALKSVDQIEFGNGRTLFKQRRDVDIAARDLHVFGS